MNTLLKIIASKRKEKVLFIDEKNRKCTVELFLNNVQFTYNFLSENTSKKSARRNFSIISPNCFNYLYFLFALLDREGAAVNLNPNLSNLEIQDRLGLGKVSILVTTVAVYQKIKDNLNNTGVEQVIIIDEEELEFKPLKVVFLKPTISYSVDIEKDVAFLQFTGGTTGVTKAAVITNQQIKDNIDQLTQHIGSYIPLQDLLVLIAFPFYHIFSIVFNLLFIVENQGVCVIYKDLRNTDLIIQLLKTYPISFTVAVNTWYKKLMQHPEFSKIDFSNVKASFAGGEYVPITTKEQWRNLTGMPLYSAYGLTETCSLAIVSPLNNKNIEDSLGVAIPDTQVQLFDENNKIIYDENTPGEIVLKGKQVIVEYFENIEETKNAFYEGWFKTGDIAVRIYENHFKLVDRKKDMISVSGNKVYPNEVESVISKLEDVLDVGVVAKKSEKSGEEVVACVVLKEKSLLKNEEIIDFCTIYLSSFKVPKQIYRFKELPKTPIGKTFRKELREIIKLKQINHD
jgi:acyl-CoA synthetase (AMP-forming)/AMP-acid ligase II